MKLNLIIILLLITILANYAMGYYDPSYPSGIALILFVFLSVSVFNMLLLWYPQALKIPLVLNQRQKGRIKLDLVMQVIMVIVILSLI